MATLEATLKDTWVAILPSDHEGNIERFSPAESQESTIYETDAANTVVVREYTIHYHPIAALVGKYSNNAFWNELEEIMKRNRESDNADESIE